MAANFRTQLFDATDNHFDFLPNISVNTVISGMKYNLCCESFAWRIIKLERQ